jgi:hypothetical protein
MLPNYLQTLTKVCTAQRNYFEGNVVNRCKITYFCAVNQIQEHFEINQLASRVSSVCHQHYVKHNLSDMVMGSIPNDVTEFFQFT